LPAIVWNLARMLVTTLGFLGAAVVFETIKERIRTRWLRIPIAVNVLHVGWFAAFVSCAVYALKAVLQTITGYAVNGEEFSGIGSENFRTFAAFAILYTMLFGIAAWLGRWRTWREITVIGVLLTVLVVVNEVVRGFVYIPATEWTFGLNVRVASLLTAIAGILILMRLWDAGTASIPKLLQPYIQPFLAGSAFLLVFTLVTGEASDWFHSQIMRVYALPPYIHQSSSAQTTITGLENAKQLSISSVWLVYAVVLMVFGIARRVRPVRLAALGLAALAIVKIFLYDLSFLTTPYRIGSFIGLGVVLLLVSYLYQRFKDVIVDAPIVE
jgi:uncharacterized membrane protein